MSARPGLQRTVILQAAAELADTHGFQQVTLALLANKLGVRSPSLYNHINGLDGLRQLMAVYSIEQLIEAMTKAAVGRSGETAVRAISEAYLNYARSHPGLYEALLKAPDPEDTEVTEASEQLLELILQVLSSYQLEQEEALHVVRGLRSLLHGFASLEQSGGFGLPLDLNTSFDVLLTTYLSGLELRTHPQQ